MGTPAAHVGQVSSLPWDTWSILISASWSVCIQGASIADPMLNLAALSPIWFKGDDGKPSTQEELKGLPFAVLYGDA